MAGVPAHINRETRKAVPSHKPGIPWEPDEWEAFKAWAIQDGAKVGNVGMRYEHLAWRVNEILHRTDGPAVVYNNGDVFWFKEGVPYTDGTFTEQWVL